MPRIEHTRTNAGNKLYKQLTREGWGGWVSVREVIRRIGIRVKRIEVNEDGVPWGTVYTRLDRGEWVNEGRYVLSK